MADHVDIANEIVEVCLDDALRRALGKSAPESHPDFDGAHCVDCDDEIPAGRLALGRVRCVICQGKLEAAAARARHNILVRDNDNV